MFILRALVVAAVFLFSFDAAYALDFWMWTPGDTVDNSSQSLFSEGYHPNQPIAFSHRLHTTEKGINCEFCHSSARRSISAGVPSLNACMGCHKLVKPDSPEIQKLAELAKKNQPVQWTKVHDLPDFVRFSHKVHVNAKNASGSKMLVCQDCHGQVQGMKTAEQFAPLQMGWCITCHNQEKIPAKDGKPAVKNAPVTCNTCHF